MATRGLTRDQWADLLALVHERDLREAWRRSTDWLLIHTPFERWRRMSRTPCVARFLDPEGSGPCSGRWTFNHVHERGKAAMGKKAPDDERHLVTVCEQHHGLARVAGFSWATSKRGIDLQQTYLEALYSA